jgi:PKD repeat protein
VNVQADPGSYVGISRDGVLHGAGYIDSSGSAAIPITPIGSEGLADIVINCQFRVPYVSTISVTGSTTPPTADFVGTPTSGMAPLTVNFTDQSLGATSWSWDFGDTGTSSDRNPTYVYTAPGTYTVTLTVTNSYGSDTEIKTNYITVQPPQSCIGTITNAGFETGTTSGWTEIGFVGITSDSHTGSYAVNLTDANSSVEQVVVDLCANTTYTVSCWGKAKSKAGVYLGVKNYGGAEQTVKFTDSKNFVQKSITFTTGATNTSVTIFFIKLDRKFTGTGDDFEIVKN